MQEELIDVLTKIECEALLKQEDISAMDLEALLEARRLKIIDFLLVDTREWMEWLNGRIKGVNFLAPTTSFYNAILEIEDKKAMPIIVYCHSGSRSAYCQKLMLKMGFKQVSNLDYGIMSYRGELLSGE